MYKNIFHQAGALITIFYMTIVLFGQQSSAPPPPPPPPPPSVDYFPDRWMEFASPEGRFKAKFPKLPKESTEEIQDGDVKVTVRIVQYRGLFTCQISYLELPSGVTASNQIKLVFDGIRDSTLGRAQQFSPKVIEEKDISEDGYQGRFLDYQISDKFRNRTKWIIVGNTLYEILVLAPIHEHAMESDNGYEKLSLSFLNSFHPEKPSVQK